MCTNTLFEKSVPVFVSPLQRDLKGNEKGNYSEAIGATLLLPGILTLCKLNYTCTDSEKMAVS